MTTSGERAAGPAISGHGAASPGRLAAAGLSPHNNFDLIRLAAAAQVAIVHTSSLLGLAIWSPVRYVLLALPGVPMFFVTSGFLLAGSLERDSSLARYAQNRALRIYPALWACFAFTLIVLTVSGVVDVPLLASAHGVGWVAAQLSIASTTPAQVGRFGVGGAPNGSLWTIGVEVGFYVILAFVWVLLVKRARPALADLGLALIALVSFVAAAAGGAGPIAGSTGLTKVFVSSPFPYVWVFFIGVLARRRWGRVRPVLEGRAWLWVPLAVLVYHLLPAPTPQPVGVAAWAGLAADRVLLGLAMLSAAYTATTLADRVLRGVDISYGVYLYHFVLIGAVVQAGISPSWGIALLVLAATVALASVSWLVVEAPALRLKARPRSPRGPAAAPLLGADRG